ncbi:unnamed protein product [Linum trigynum]|uniref:Uncharacterized protein n=1 Tax=Linum trigynum TaxID=586398 RepID=A0AAV2FFZ4_9ROSI
MYAAAGNPGAGRHDSTPPPRAASSGPHAFAVQSASAASSSLSAEIVDKMINSAIQKSMPAAINSAFAALQVSGSDDGEADRKGE